MMVLGYAVFCEWTIGTQLPMFIMGDAYVEMYRSSQGDAYADALSALVKGYMVPVVIVVIAVCAVLRGRGLHNDRDIFSWRTTGIHFI